MKGLRLKPFLGGIVVTAAVAAVAVPSALATTSSRGGSAGPVHVQQVRGYSFITDTLGGTRHPVAAQQVEPNRFTSDPIADVQATGPYIGTLPPGYTLGGGAPLAVTAHGYDANAYQNTGSASAALQGYTTSGPGVTRPSRGASGSARRTATTPTRTSPAARPPARRHRSRTPAGITPRP